MRSIAQCLLLAAAASLTACAGGTEFTSDDSGPGGDDVGVFEAGADVGAAEGGRGHHDARSDSAPADSGTGDGAHLGDAAGDAAGDATGDAPTPCIIGGSTYPGGTTNPADPCQTCDTAESTSAWTNVTDETACAGGSCCSGTCDDETTDPSHCGGCGNVCPSVTDGTADCASSVCHIVCDPGYVLSGTTCIVESTTCPVTFPDTISTTGGTDYPGTLGLGGTTAYRWHTGDYVEETYACSNATITQLTVDFQMSDSTDSFCTGTLDWNVMINGTVVGSYSWLGGLGPGTQTVSQTYTFSAIAAISGSYTLEYIATSTVCSGGGNWNWNPGGSASMD